MPDTVEPRTFTIAERARNTIFGILEESGVDPEILDERGDSELTLQELTNTMARVWVMYAKAAAFKEEWVRELEVRKQAKDALSARAYEEASVSLGPKSTETAKKNWIIQNKADVVAQQEQVMEAQYMVGQANVAANTLKMRCDMLQSINKTKVAELQNLHVHLREQEE
jgi:hypothetical protein